MNIRYIAGIVFVASAHLHVAETLAVISWIAFRQSAQVVHPTAEQIVGHLVHSARSDDWLRSTDAIEALGRIRPVEKKVVAVLTELLPVEDVVGRTMICIAFAGMGPAAEDAVPSLLQLLHDRTQDDGDRAMAAKTLSNMRLDSREVTAVLIKVMKDATESSEIQESAAFSLWSSQSTASLSVPALIDSLADDDRSMRVTAAWALGKLGPCAESAVPGLRERLEKSGQDNNERVNMASALGRIGTGAIDARGELLKLLENADADVRYTAITALTLIGVRIDNQVELLIDAVENASTRFRAEAMSALSTLGAEAQAATPALLSQLGAEQPRDQRAAREALDAVGYDIRDAIPSLRGFSSKCR